MLSLTIYQANKRHTLTLLNIIVISKFYEIVGRVNGFAGSTRRRNSVDKQGPTVVHQKPGPLQTIFNLHPDEVNCFFFSSPPFLDVI